MGQYFIDLITYRFIVRGYRCFNRIVKHIVNIIVACNGFACLRFLGMEGVLLFQLLYPVAFGGR